MSTFLVPSSTGNGTTYEVDLDLPYCSCPAFKHRPGECKHIKAVRAKPNRYKRTEDGDVLSEPSNEPGLFTIGHSNHTTKELFDLLDEHRINVVVDIRTKPYSKFNPQFSRFTLRDALHEHGIDYFWCGKELGGLASVSTKSAGFKQRMAAIMRMAKMHRVAFMCSEGPPEKCHRAMKLAAYIHRLPGEPLTVTHILRDGGVRDSRDLEADMPKKWLWVDFGGESGA